MQTLPRALISETAEGRKGNEKLHKWGASTTGYE
jgi:hypothetical protein